MVMYAPVSKGDQADSKKSYTQQNEAEFKWANENQVAYQGFVNGVR